MQPPGFRQWPCTDQKQPLSGSVATEGMKMKAGRSGVRKEQQLISHQFPQINISVVVNTEHPLQKHKSRDLGGFQAAGRMDLEGNPNSCLQIKG